MINQVKKASGVVLLSLASVAAYAMPITDTVIVDGTQWAQPNLFVNNSWNDINAQCPGGVCNAASVLNNWSLDGWTWATASKVGDLFAAVTPHPGGIALFEEINSSWAPSFFAVTGFNPVTSNATVDSIRAFASTTTTFNGVVRADRPNIQHSAFQPGATASDKVTTRSGALSFDLSGSEATGWFFRPASSVSASVPEPSLLGLLALAFGGLCWRRQKAR